MRFITYTNPSVLTDIPASSNNNGSTGAIESQDVFGHPDGTTTSKYYGEYRAIDTQTYGDTGSGPGVFMNIGNRETSSGGPFFKDIDFQNNELYNYTFSGHSQTENFRPGLKGFYALEFTTGATPAAPDYSFIDTLGIGSDIAGYVGSSGRGTLAGIASGVPATLQETVGLSNAADQYWATPSANTGAYVIAGILPGTYTETVYQGELAVGTRMVTITAGQTTAANITDTLYAPSAASTIFRIGTSDGTPLGFLNADKITNMHPTDVRMSPWADSTGMTNFTVGADSDSSWPMAEWHAGASAAPYVDTANQITFSLTAAQAATAQTLQIGLTRLSSGRPTIDVNSGAWNSPVPALTTQPSSRGLTTGNWRGNNCVYTFNIPTNALKAGTNTIDIYCTSGSTGTLYSGYQIYDAVDLVNTSSIANAPVLSRIAVSPASPSVPLNGTQAFAAAAFDQFNNPMPANVTWSASSGTIDGTGLYAAGGTAGTATIAAASGSVSGDATLTIVNTAPTIATAATASPNYGSGATANLSVLGADDGGEANLTYTWTADPSNPAPSSISFASGVSNGANAAKNAAATFDAVGTYGFQVTIADGSGLSVTSTVSVTVMPTLISLHVAPSSPTVGPHGTDQFTADGVDQFGNPLAISGAVWSLIGQPSGASAGVDSNGVLSIGTVEGNYTVQASLNGLVNFATVNTTPAVNASITLSPGSVTLNAGAMQQFSTTVYDQFGSTVASPTITWSVTGAGNVIGATGLLTAGATAGTFVVTAAAGSVATTASLIVNKTIPSLTLTKNTTAPIKFGQSVTLTATMAAVSPGPGVPTGTITFKDGSITLGAATLRGGIATLTTTTIPAGINSITAVYGGDANFSAITSAALIQTVNPSATTTKLTKNTTTAIKFGQSVTFTATMAAVSPGGGVPTGVVAFKDGSTVLGTATISGGVATFTSSALPVGSNSITAVCSGDGNFTASTSAALAQTVNPAATTTKLAKSTTTAIKFGKSVTFTATLAVISPGGGIPIGAVIFMDNGTQIGTGTLNAAGVATFTITMLPIGSESITAVWSGNLDYASSVSNIVRQTVTP